MVGVRSAGPEKAGIRAGVYTKSGGGGKESDASRYGIPAGGGRGGAARPLPRPALAVSWPRMNAARPLLQLLAAALLAACAPAPPDAPPAAGWEELRALPPDEAWAGVDRHPPERRAGLRLDLLEEWARSERWDALAARLPELDALELGPPAADRRQRLRARLLLRSGEAAAALAALAGLPDDGETAALRIDAYERLGDARGALRARLARAGPDSAAGAAAWERLLATPAARLQDWRDAAADAAWRGWLDLALLSRPGSRPRVTPEETLREWELRYGDGHPARAWLPAALEALRALHPRVRRLAALLPVSRAQTRGGIERQGHSHREWDREIGTGTETEGHQ